MAGHRPPRVDRVDDAERRGDQAGDRAPFRGPPVLSLGEPGGVVEANRHLFVGSLEYVPTEELAGVAESIIVNPWVRSWLSRARSGDSVTTKRARRWIHEMASYLSWSKGGAGILHCESHSKAFYASWIVRFLDPRCAPCGKTYSDTGYQTSTSTRP